MELEDEADIPVAESRQFLIAQSSCLRAIDNQPPAIRCVERADDLLQGCLTRPAGAYDSDNLALVYREVDNIQYMIGTETFRYSFGLYHIKFLRTCEARKQPNVAGI